MKTLLKKYGFKSDMQYFELLCRTLKGAHKNDAKVLFNDMPRKVRKAFILSIYGSWGSGLSDSEKAFFMNLL